MTGRTLKDVQAAHRAGRAASLRDLRPDVPEALAQVVEKGLAAEPSRRHATALAFATALTPVLPPEVARSLKRVLAAAIVGTLALALVWVGVDSFRSQPGPIGIANVQVWKGPQVHVEGGLSLNGQYLSTVDENGNIALRDLVTRVDRTLTTEGSPYVYAESAISRDGTQVAYTWHNPNGKRNVLRAVTFDATSASAPRTLVSDPAVEWIVPWDWSPDGKWIAVSVGRPDRTVHMALLSIADNVLTTLKTADWRGPSRMVFSPDARLVAYDIAIDDTGQRDVFVMDVRTHRETAVVVNARNDLVAGWTPDGRSILFTSDRSGYIGVWERPIENGAPAGKEKLIAQDLGPRSFTIGVTNRGALVYGKRLSSLNVHVAEVDFAAGKMLSPPVEATEHYLMENNSADWNADGSRLTFVSGRPANVADIQKKLSILSVEGRELLRELRPALDDFQRPRWAPDGSITVQGTDGSGRQGIYRVDSQNGATSPIVQCERPGRCVQASWFKDGSALVYLRTSPKNSAVMVRDFASGKDESLRPDLSAGVITGVGLSPDERYASYIHHDAVARTATLYLHPVAGGPPRPLVIRPLPEKLENLAEWTPDSKYLIFGVTQGTGLSALTLWSAPVSGGEPVEIPDLKPRIASTTLRIHPDGRRVSFSMGQPQLEVWRLSNFLPAPAAPTAKK